MANIGPCLVTGNVIPAVNIDAILDAVFVGVAVRLVGVPVGVAHRDTRAPNEVALHRQTSNMYVQSGQCLNAS